MYRCSFAKTFWILLCRKVRAQKLIHDTNSMLFSQPRCYLTFPLSCVWNSTMFPIMFYKVLTQIAPSFFFSVFFKCLFITSRTLHFTLLPPPLLYSEVLFLFLILYLGALFLQIKKEKKKIFIENHKKIWEIVVLTDRCINKMISKKNVM